MRLYLIDYENVNSSGLHGIGQVSKNDRVILFYSHSANTLSFEVMDEMIAAGISPERICLEQGGKNALDFQLVTLLGYMIANHTADEYFIISRDSGYGAAVTLCKDYLHTKVQLKPSLKAALAVRPIKTAENSRNFQKKQAKSAKVSLHKRATVVQVQPAAEAVQHTVSPAQNAKSKPQYSESIAHEITVDTVLSLMDMPIDTNTAEGILQCLNESHSKTEFHNALQQFFGTDIVKDYYRCMKPCFAIALNE